MSMTIYNSYSFLLVIVYIVILRGLSHKIVYIACYWKSNERIELVFSHIKDRLFMCIIAKYHLYMRIDNEKLASCIILVNVIIDVTPDVLSRRWISLQSL